MRKCHGAKNGKSEAKNNSIDPKLKRERFKCEVCLESRTTKADLKRHIELQHFQDKRFCPYGCSEVEFSTEEEWIKHLEACNSDKIVSWVLILSNTLNCETAFVMKFSKSTFCSGM